MSAGTVDGFRRQVRTDNNERRAPDAVMLCFGGIGFWCDGVQLKCRIVAPGCAADAPGFEIRLRGVE